MGCEIKGGREDGKLSEMWKKKGKGRWRMEGNKGNGWDDENLN